MSRTYFSECLTFTHVQCVGFLMSWKSKDVECWNKIKKSTDDGSDSKALDTIGNEEKWRAVD